jgi:hypothetical protein
VIDYPPYIVEAFAKYSIHEPLQFIELSRDIDDCLEFALRKVKMKLYRMLADSDAL